MKRLRILFVGQTVPGSRTLQRIRVLQEMGHSVTVVPTQPPGATYEDAPGLVERVRYRLRVPADDAGANQAVFAAVGEVGADVIWLDRAVTIRRRTLREAKHRASGLRVVWYAEDDMMNPRHLSWWTERALSLIDLWVTTKSMNAEPGEMPAKGVRNVLFVDNSYDPLIHRPVPVSAEDSRTYGSDVSFVGTYEAERARSLGELARRGLDVRVWGNGWRRVTARPHGLRLEERPVYDDEYAKVVSASRINLCFLRKENRDLQTCRSVEIPAMGGLMMHERNPEIRRMFTEDEEAVYFESDAELVLKCRTLLDDETRRTRIAQSGHRAVLAGGYRHHDRLELILDRAEKVSSR